jgi:hypothetical protein
MKKKKKEEIAETHPDLKGLNIRVNEFGEITTNISLEKINDFLDKNVVDKKLNEDKWEEKKKKSGEKKTAASVSKGKKTKR